jgi:hypothetical protein
MLERPWTSAGHRRLGRVRPQPPGEQPEQGQQQLDRQRLVPQPRFQLPPRQPGGAGAADDGEQEQGRPARLASSPPVAARRRPCELVNCSPPMAVRHRRDGPRSARPWRQHSPGPTTGWPANRTTCPQWRAFADLPCHRQPGPAAASFQHWHPQPTATVPSRPACGNATVTSVVGSTQLTHRAGRSSPGSFTTAAPRTRCRHRLPAFPADAQSREPGRLA